MNNTVVECINVSKNYALENNPEGVKALKNISFELKEGDRLGLVGLNGSGKSTLLKILSGMIKPSDGKIIINKNIKNLSGFDSLLHAELSGKDNILFQLKLIGLSKTETEAALKEVIEFSELGEAILQPVRTYSSGMMLRLSFSIFKVIQPEILLLDEVLSAGDMKFQKKVDALMKHHLNNVSAIIMASHQLSEIFEYCNKCLVLNKGKIEFFGNVSDAVTHYLVSNKIEDENNSSKILVKRIYFEGGKNVFERKDKIKIVLEFENLFEKKEFFPVLNISNPSSKILTDCLRYRNDYIEIFHDIGTYEYKIELPNNFFNFGDYFVSILFGGINEIFIELTDVLNFKVVEEKGLETQKWNAPTFYPIMPILDWSSKKLN
jgi:ABC-type polysaccharide/polyol phosphate transport system ATPase subunit